MEKSMMVKPVNETELSARATRHGRARMLYRKRANEVGSGVRRFFLVFMEMYRRRLSKYNNGDA